MTTKINSIEGIVKTVTEHGERIAQLEATTATLSKETDSVRALATRSSPIASSPTAGITIAGVPTAISDTPLAIASKILATLNVPELTADILDIRQITRKPPLLQNLASNDNHDITKSFIVNFESPHISYYIIKKRRAHGVLTLRDVFTTELSGNIFINEFLHSDVYNLLRKTKTIARERGWKYIWTTESQIYAQKRDGSRVISISTEADLVRLD